jgi:hypothetical protein
MLYKRGERKADVEEREVREVRAGTIAHALAP